MGFKIPDAEYAEWVRKGLVPASPPVPDVRSRATSEKRALVVPLFVPPGTWVVPCEVPSLANSRDWRVRNRVAQAHRKAVSRAMGRNLEYLVRFAEWFHRGRNLRVKLIRLGGNALDRTANLPASLKYIEDGIALMIGADDGDGRWQCECQQQPGGAMGVRIELERLTA